MRIWYTSVGREHDAATLTIGHYVHPFMIIPPNSQRFVTTAFMTEECSTRVSIYSPEFATAALILLLCSSFVKRVSMCLQVHFIHMWLVSRNTHVIWKYH